MRTKGFLQAAILVSTIACGTASAASSLLFASGDITLDSNYASGGILHALNNDMNTDGFLVMGTIGYGRYNYDATSAGVEEHYSGTLNNYSIMAGYQKIIHHTKLSAFIGPNYVRDNTSPPKPEGVTVSEYGIKGELSFEHDFSGYADLLVMGNYSTANKTYFSQATYLFKQVPSIQIGPEVTVFGSDTYGEQRYGVHAKTELAYGINVGLGMGYANNDLLEESGYVELRLNKYI